MARGATREAASAAARALAAMLSGEPCLLPASELHDKLALFDAAAQAYRAELHRELQRRPTHCRSPDKPVVSGAAASVAPFRLIHLSDDEIEAVFGVLADSLEPHAPRV